MKTFKFILCTLSALIIPVFAMAQTPPFPIGVVSAPAPLPVIGNYSETIARFHYANPDGSIFGPWVVPAGVTQVRLEAQGGDSGGRRNTILGDFASKTINVTPGQTYQYFIGTGALSDLYNQNSNSQYQQQSAANASGLKIPNGATLLQVGFIPPHFVSYDQIAADTLQQWDSSNGYLKIIKIYQNTLADKFYYPGTTTWAIPQNVNSITVEVWGGGGGGGASSEGGGTPDAGTGGGGGYAKKTYAVTPGSKVTIKVGDGGSAGIANYGSGGNGTLSYFKLGVNGDGTPAPVNRATDLYATGGGGGKITRISGAGGSGFNGDTVANGHAGETVTGFPLGDGGVSGKPNCIEYNRPDKCALGYQDNNASDQLTTWFDNGADNANSGDTGACNHIAYNESCDSAGGDGYQPGNGGADGAGSRNGGKGGNGMVVITWAMTDPSVPQNLTATPGSCGTNFIDLSWNTVTGAASYNVYKDGSLFKNIPQPNTGTTASTTDIGLQPLTGYSYAVSSVTSGTESAKSSAVYQFSPNACPEFSISNGGNISIAPGSGGNSSLNLTYLSGDPYSVNLAKSGAMPSGVTGSIVPGTCWLSTTSTSCTNSFNVTTSPSASYASIPVTITGTTPDTKGGSISHQTQLSINILNSTSLSATCTSVPSNPTAGNSVTFTANPAGGISPYRYFWNGDLTTVGQPNTYTLSNSTSGAQPPLTVKDAANNSVTPSCPSVAGTNNTISLKIGSSVNDLNHSSITITRGNSFALGWTKPASYTSCSTSISNNGTWAWNSSVVSSASSIGNLATANVPIGTYAFTLQCSDPNVAGSSDTSIVTLILKSSSTIEI